MSNQGMKNVPIYFYYLGIERIRKEDDNSVYDIEQVSEAFSGLLSYICEKPLIERRKDFKESDMVVWLDSFTDLKNGNYNIVFKSAKYNHVRNEIDTEIMQKLGTRKRRQDGDEEKTHICIRLKQGQTRFLAVHESNLYGISINRIVDYLNVQFEKYNENFDSEYHYRLYYEIMPGNDFLNEIKMAKTISSLQLTVSRYDMKDDFMVYAGRENSEIDDDVGIYLKKPKGADKFPENLIKAYYDDLQSKNQIKRISARGVNSSGARVEINTDLIKMKRSLNVVPDTITNEVNTSDFFGKANDFINEARKSL